MEIQDCSFKSLSCFQWCQFWWSNSCQTIIWHKYRASLCQNNLHIIL